MIKMMLLAGLFLLSACSPAQNDDVWGNTADTHKSKEKIEDLN